MGIRNRRSRNPDIFIFQQYRKEEKDYEEKDNCTYFGGCNSNLPDGMRKYKQIHRRQQRHRIKQLQRDQQKQIPVQKKRQMEKIPIGIPLFHLLSVMSIG